MQTRTAVAISGVNSAGKSRLLQRLRASDRLAGCTVFEMDDLRYWRPERQVTAEQAARWFSETAGAGDPSGGAALECDVVRSGPEERTIKLAFCRLCASGRPFITVNPRHLRGEAEAHFFDLLQQAWGVSVYHVAVLPSVLRYAINILKRRDGRWRRNIGEYLRIRRDRRRYALVVRNRAIAGMTVDLDALVALLAEAPGR